MFKHIFADSEEKFLKANVLYADSSDNLLYKNYDSTAETAYTEVVTKDELINLFKKGMVLIDTGTEFVRPTTLAIETNYAAVSYANVTTVSTTVTPAMVVFYSKGYSAS